MSYCQANMIRRTEDFKREIIIQDAVTDKMIGASIVNSHPKLVSLKSMFGSLFEEPERVQTPEEQIRILRGMMNS